MPIKGGKKSRLKLLKRLVQEWPNLWALEKAPEQPSPTSEESSEAPQHQDEVCYLPQQPFPEESSLSLAEDHSTRMLQEKGRKYGAWRWQAGRAEMTSGAGAGEWRYGRRRGRSRGWGERGGAREAGSKGVTLGGFSRANPRGQLGWTRLESRRLRLDSPHAAAP